MEIILVYSSFRAMTAETYIIVIIGAGGYCVRPPGVLSRRPKTHCKEYTVGLWGEASASTRLHSPTGERYRCSSTLALGHHLAFEGERRMENNNKSLEKEQGSAEGVHAVQRQQPGQREACWWSWKGLGHACQTSSLPRALSPAKMATE